MASTAGSPQGTLMKIENDTNTASCPDYYPRARLGKPAKWLQKEWFQIKIKNNNHIGKALALPWRIMDFRSLATDDGFKERKNIIQDTKTFCFQNFGPCNTYFSPFKFATKKLTHWGVKWLSQGPVVD